MNTSDDCGFVYVATGKKYIEEAIYSSRSYKKHHPNVPICIFTDDVSTVKRVKHVFDQVIAISNVRYTYIDKIAMKDSPYERSIFIDTDTICAAPMYELFDLLHKCDLAVHQNAEGLEYDYKKFGLNISMAEFNTGVLGFSKSKISKHQFFEQWEKLYIEYEYLKLTDQFSFRLLLYNSNVRYCWIPSAYNFFIYMPAYTGIQAKIIHGRPFQKLEEVAIKINDLSKLRNGFQRTYYPEFDEVIYDQLNLSDSWKLFKLIALLCIKNVYRYLKYGKSYFIPNS
jgi:hypothetical protein